MERRDFLKVLPLSALAPKVIKEGVLSLELPHNSHLVFFVDETAILNVDWWQNEHLMPPGATGGAIIYTRGNPEDAIKVYRLDDSEKV